MRIEYSRQPMKRLLKRKKLIISVVLLITVCVVFLQTNLSPDLYFFTWKRFEDVSCHYSYENDGLPDIEDDFAPPTTSIHFHETSCRGWLNTRQACAVESAARTHPNWQINVFFTGPVPKESIHTGSLKVLKTFENIKFLRLHLQEYAKDTPLEDMVNDGALNRTRWRISHTSDILRYLSLYKWGGVYLDLDVVVVKSFEDLVSNWAARESDLAIAAGALSFSKDELGRIVADAAIRELKENYRGDTWGHNGPGVITRILQRMCDTSYLNEMSATNCQGFGVYGPELFYPVSWYDAKDYFEDKELHVDDPYSYHVWNKFTENFKVTRQSAYAKLAKKYCPTIYETYGNDFGL